MPAVVCSQVDPTPLSEHSSAGRDLWARLERVPDPRDPRGRIYPLAHLIAVAICAFTAAGHDHLVAIGQWLSRADSQDLQRLRAPRDPWTGQHRRVDESTVRKALTLIDPVALSTALLAHQPPGQARNRRWKAVAVDGKTARGARRPDGTQVHILGAADHADAHLVHQVEVDRKTNETSAFGVLLDQVDLTETVVTFDALLTVAANMTWLTQVKNAHYIAVIKKNQKRLYQRCAQLPWKAVRTSSLTRDAGHGRRETRTIKIAQVDDLEFPGARQAIKIHRWRQVTGLDKATRATVTTTSRETVYALTDLDPTQITPTEINALVRGHWIIEDRVHYVRDVSFGEDRSQIRTGHAPINTATIRSSIINTLRATGCPTIPAGRRAHVIPSEAIRLHGLAA